MAHGAVQGLRYFREGAPDRPLIALVPGGGHLGRVAYGHPDGDPADFLDHWLKREGCGLLALSWPSDHPAVECRLPDLTLRMWAEWVAEEIAQAAVRQPAAPILIALWSMAGRGAMAIGAALATRGVRAAGMVALAAAAPLPGIMPLTPGGEPLTPEGLWATAPTPGREPEGKLRYFLDLFAAHEAEIGHTIIPRDIYLSDYLCNTPIMLRGEAQRSVGGRIAWSAGDALDDLRIAEPVPMPLVGAIIPASRADPGHALLDGAMWSAVNARTIARLAGRPEGEGWTRAVALAHEAPARLRCFTPYGHFFLLGAEGARSTVADMLALHKAIGALEAEFAALN